MTREDQHAVRSAWRAARIQLDELHGLRVQYAEGDDLADFANIEHRLLVTMDRLEDELQRAVVDRLNTEG